MGARHSTRNRSHRSSGRYSCSGQADLPQHLATVGVYKGFELPDTYGEVCSQPGGRNKEDCQPGDINNEDCQPGEKSLGLKASLSVRKDDAGFLWDKSGEDPGPEQEKKDNCPPEITGQIHLETQGPVTMKIIVEDWKGSREEVTEVHKVLQMTKSLTRREIPENPGSLVKSFPYVVLAKYDYTAVLQGELSFHKGDYMLLISKEDESWWLVMELVKNTYGYAPSTFLEVQEHI
ncbi:tyrosine-protein kinase HCK [Procambarus clarkii]|uniref:tyrosine-protein kinase HCK n=1 Tax=Procambarus clarkii TaxID=6728 RepID=UPI001E672B31|nr:tyrosine-protein kinase HCK-like [Procambarus clarkii]